LRFDPLYYIWNANLRGFSVCYLSCSTHWFALLHTAAFKANSWQV